MTPTEKEKLEVLNGDRGDSSKAAVRLGMARELVNSINVSPSGDNTKDIAALFAAINALRIALR